MRSHGVDPRDLSQMISRFAVTGYMQNALSLGLSISGALHPLDFSMTIKDNIDNKGNTTFIAMITGAKRFGPPKSCAAVT